MTQIACINQSQVPIGNWQSGPDFDSLLQALTDFAAIFAQAWEMPAPQLVSASSPSPGQWTLTFTDLSESDLGGVHNVGQTGLPAMYVFVKAMVQANVPISLIASHEIAEALADPGVNLCAITPNLQICAYETCDPVESSTFRVDNLTMSDFVLPCWFRNYPEPKYDYLGLCKTPFEILPGGYASILTRTGWTPIYSSSGQLPMVRPRLRRQMRPVGRV